MRNIRHTWLLVLALAVAACGGAADAEAGEIETRPSESADTTMPDPDDIPSLGSSFLEKDYAEGAWCDTQGLSWVIAGGWATASTDGSNYVQIGHLDQVFAPPATELISKSDDEFTVSQAEEEVTYMRGSCT